MKLTPQQLNTHLQKHLLPVYWLAGDEPLQMMEAADAIRQAARQNGFVERQVLDVDAGFEWSVLQFEAATLSLFAERKLLDLRLPSAKPGREGAAALTAYLKQPPEDTLLLITSGRLDKTARTTAWFKAVDRVGGVLQIWDLNPAQTHQFVGERLRRAGFQADPEAVRLLTENVEGNLLAAVQEIEKLRLLREPGMLSAADVLAAVVDSSRYDPFELADAALHGDGRRVLKIMQGLQGEGVAVHVVLWALSRDIRMLADFSQLLAAGHDPQPALQSMWNPRKTLLQRAARRKTPQAWLQLLRFCTLVDRTAKGIRQGNVWDELLQLALDLAGQPALGSDALLGQTPMKLENQ